LAQLIAGWFYTLAGVKMELPEIRPEERTPTVEALLGLIRRLLDVNAQQEETIRQLRDEVDRLKGQTRRPNLQPSRLETPSPKAAQPTGEKEKRPGSAKRPKTAELTIHREQVLLWDNAPASATLRGYERYVVQDLRCEPFNTLFWRGRYDLPGDGSALAPIPDGVLPVEGGHFGATLVAFILAQYHQAQVTEPLLLEQLHHFGIDISAGQLHRILTERKEHFHQEKDEVRAAGLKTASYIGTDDTGARHQGANGYCTVIGNDLFTCFESSPTKSRLNFLQVLHGSQRIYAVNETTLEYWRRQQLAAALVEKLNQPQQFHSEAAWQAHLAELGIDNERHVRIATEGALLGGLIAAGASSQLVVLSDGAPQFVVLVHAACWVHAERPLAKLVPHNEEHRAAIEHVRDDIWKLYQDMKAYRAQPEVSQRPVLEVRFDALVEQKTNYPSINGPLKEMREHKADLLLALERPEVPLHNNAMESDIREFVKRRKISGGTRSDAGRRCRDTFASLKKTCRKLGICFWQYLQDRVRSLGKIARLADLIRAKAQLWEPPAPIAVAPIAL
jgi:hypothetical protein